MQTRIGRAAAAGRRLDQVELLDRVDHQDRRAVVLDPAEHGERGAVGRRVGEQQVVEAVLVEPQRLRERERHQALEAAAAASLRSRIASSSERQRTDLLATRIGVPSRPPQHLVRVRPHRVEVHERERRVHAREDPLELLVGPLMRRCTVHRHDPGSTVYRPRSWCWAGWRRSSSAPRSPRRCSTRSGPAAPCCCGSLFAAVILCALLRPALRGRSARTLAADPRLRLRARGDEPEPTTSRSTASRWASR